MSTIELFEGKQSVISNGQELSRSRGTFQTRRGVSNIHQRLWADYGENHDYSDLYAPEFMRQKRDALIKTAGESIMDLGMESGVVLDVGIGPGPIALALLDRFTSLRVIGIDISPTLVGQGQSRMNAHIEDGRLALVEADAISPPLPIDDESIDQVVSGFVLQYFGEEGRANCFSELYRVIKPGGAVHFSHFDDPNFQFGTFMKRMMELGLEDPSDIQSFMRIMPIAKRIDEVVQTGLWKIPSRESLVGQLKDAGFVDIVADDTSFRYPDTQAEYGAIYSARKAA